MQAIQTKWLGPANTRGSRVEAFAEAFPRGVTVGWDYGAGNATGQSDTEANHDAAARARSSSRRAGMGCGRVDLRLMARASSTCV
jgi:hypothetical protein